MSDSSGNPSVIPSQFEGLVNNKFKESLRTRLLFKSIDAAMIAHLLPPHPIIDQVKTVWNPRTSNHERVAAFVNLLNAIRPGASTKISHFFCRYGQLPYRVRDINLMSYGSGSSVFLLDTTAGKFVMKVYRRSLGRTGKDLFDIANLFQRKFHTVSSFYNGEYQLVSPALFLIIQGPALGAPAAAMIQAYIPGEKKDLFQDFTEKELLDLFAREAGLKEQFIFFARKTLEVYNQHGLCFDFIGRENLLMTRVGEKYKLSIIDYGVFNLEHIKVHAPAHFEHINIHLDRLNEILNKVS